MNSLLHSMDHNGYTMLHWAAASGHAEVLRYVIDELKLDPTVCDKVSVVYARFVL